MPVVFDRVSLEDMRRRTGDRADAASSAECMARLSH
jgi:hypothetical protein